MRSIEQPLEWIQGKREMGCSYHTLARARWNDDTIQIDLFVMPSIAVSRPIAITIGLYRDYQAVQKHRDSVESIAESGAAAGKVSRALTSLGLPKEIAALRGREVTEQIQGEAAEITAAMS